LPAQAEIGQLILAADWHVTRNRDMKRAAHVNLQECEEIVEEVRSLANRSLLPTRHSSGTDSAVCQGAWGKGRSASLTLNGKLRSGMAWRVVGRKDLDLFKVGTKDNVSDDPSRDVALRAPQSPQGWMVPLLKPEHGFPEWVPDRLKETDLPFGTCVLSLAGGQITRRMERPRTAYIGRGRWPWREFLGGAERELGLVSYIPAGAQERDSWRWKTSLKKVEYALVADLVDFLVLDLGDCRLSAVGLSILAYLMKLAAKRGKKVLVWAAIRHQIFEPQYCGKLGGAEHFNLLVHSNQLTLVKSSVSGPHGMGIDSQNIKHRFNLLCPRKLVCNIVSSYRELGGHVLYNQVTADYLEAENFDVWPTVSPKPVRRRNLLDQATGGSRHTLLDWSSALLETAVSTLMR
jgi:hypothetical protein